MSVVLPLPRKPVTRTTGVFTAKLREESGVERVEGPAEQPLGFTPDGAEVLDDGRGALAVAKDIDRARPVVQGEPEMAEHPVEERCAKDPSPPPALLLGPVLVQDDTAKRTH